MLMVIFDTKATEWLRHFNISLLLTNIVSTVVTVQQCNAICESISSTEAREKDIISISTGFISEFLMRATQTQAVLRDK